MTLLGYSDRVNHAFAFAAKHHDRQVRKGTALPCLTHRRVDDDGNEFDKDEKKADYLRRLENAS